MNRRETMLALLALAATPRAARAQPAARIMFLIQGAPPGPPPWKNPYLDAFKQGLRALGHVEGKSYIAEIRWTSDSAGKPLDLAKEIAAFKPAVILASETSARAAQLAAPSVPIVLPWSGDPVATDFAKSLARPGGNVTGMAALYQDTSAKLLELLLTIVPKVTRVAVVANPAAPYYGSAHKNLDEAARRANVGLLTIDVRSAADIDNGFARIGLEKVSAAVVIGEPLVFRQRKQVADLALRYQVASVYPAKEHVEAGGLVSYGVDLADSFRRAASDADKILKGAKPGDLPIEQASKFELVINLKTAKALGITIPQSVLLRADGIIE
ncbi:MAG TPA: ABC transporter substrate-binding protein [Burkholderiales bacterium]|nr:ABC transporter substrate-binding protein [Burkholderiales bacterium]